MSLHIKQSLNIVSLADDMISEIKDCWKNPFDSPTVIFPDPLMENWLIIIISYNFMGIWIHESI